MCTYIPEIVFFFSPGLKEEERTQNLAKRNMEEKEVIRAKKATLKRIRVKDFKVARGLEVVEEGGRGVGKDDK